MAKPTKTKNGKWTMRVYDYQDADGKQHYKRITRDTKDDCIVAAALARKERGPKEEKKVMTVGEACDRYISLCSLLSPATLDGYRKARANGFQALMGVPVDQLTEEMLQEAINDEACRIGRNGPVSAKTVSNEWGLISSSLWKVCRLKYDVRLPRRKKNLKEYPDPSLVVDAIRGSSIELPCMLALWLSFSMSEIRGLQWGDLKDGVITINRVVVDVGTVPTAKEIAKTDARIRRHRVPPYILELMEQADHSQPWIVPLNHSQIYGRFLRICEKANLDLTFHELRHLNASVMLQLDVPEKYAMERGGWSTPNTMRTVYQHTFSAERTRVDDKIDDYFAGLLAGLRGSDMPQKHDTEPCMA